MEMHATTDGPLASIAIVGRFDAFEVPAFTRVVDEIMTGGVHSVTLDLRGVPFIDSSALAQLVRCAKRCEASGGELSLSGVSDAVQVIIELTRLEVLFNPVSRAS